VMFGRPWGCFEGFGNVVRVFFGGLGDLAITENTLNCFERFT